jgi:hypothetical protein
MFPYLLVREFRDLAAIILLYLFLANASILFVGAVEEATNFIKCHNEASSFKVINWSSCTGAQVDRYSAYRSLVALDCQNTRGNVPF